MNMASHGWGCERYGWHAFEQPLGSQTVLWLYRINCLNCPSNINIAQRPSPRQAYYRVPRYVFFTIRTAI